MEKILIVEDDEKLRKELEIFLNNNFNFSVDNIIKELDLLNPIYYDLASYGHFGRTELDLSWEKIKETNNLL